MGWAGFWLAGWLRFRQSGAMKPAPFFPRPVILLAAVSLLAAAPAPLRAADASKNRPEEAKDARPRKPGPKPRRTAEGRPQEWAKQLETARRELDRTRDSLHEAQKELGAKAELISSLEARLASVTGQLEAARADLKKASGATAELAKRTEELEAERKRAGSLREELKVTQQKAAEAIARAKAAGPGQVTVVVSSSAAGTVSVSGVQGAGVAVTRAPQVAPIHYDRRSAVNYAERDRALAQVRAALKQFPQARVLITGYADDFPYPEVNQEVSDNRARFLAAHFRVNGLPKDRIEARGLGNSRPVKGQPNRRVEIEIRP